MSVPRSEILRGVQKNLSGVTCKPADDSGEEANLTPQQKAQIEYQKEQQRQLAEEQRETKEAEKLEEEAKELKKEWKILYLQELKRIFPNITELEIETKLRSSEATIDNYITRRFTYVPFEGQELKKNPRIKKVYCSLEKYKKQLENFYGALDRLRGKTNIVKNNTKETDEVEQKDEATDKQEVINDNNTDVDEKAVAVKTTKVETKTIQFTSDKVLKKLRQENALLSAKVSELKNQRNLITEKIKLHQENRVLAYQYNVLTEESKRLKQWNNLYETEKPSAEEETKNKILSQSY